MDFSDLRHDDESFDADAARVMAIAFTRRYRLRRDPAELVGHAWEGVQRARRYFDPDRGVAFSSFAWLVVSSRLVDVLRHENHRRQPTFASVDRAYEPSNPIEAREIVAKTRRTLDSVDREILDNLLRGMTQNNAGAAAGKSRGTTSVRRRRINRALAEAA